MVGGAAERMTACHTLVRKPAVANAVSANMDCHRGRRRRGAHFEVTPVDISYNFNFCVMVIIIINY